MLRDLRYAVRVLGRSPGLTCAVVLSLGVGIAANTTVFTLINAVLLRALPVHEPDRLVFFSVRSAAFARGSDESFSYPLHQQFSAEARALSGILAAGGPTKMRLAIERPGAPPDVEAVRAMPVSANYFTALGLAAAAALAGFVETLLYGVTPSDPTTFLLVALGLGATTIAAALIPARRAANVDPLTALRCE